MVVWTSHWAGMPKVSLQLSDGVKYAHEGVIDAISGTIDTGTGAVSLRAVFPNPEGMLRNGSTATLVLPYTKENALVVPQEATFEIQDKVYVYKVNESGKAESAQVTVFPLNNGAGIHCREWLAGRGSNCGRGCRIDSGEYPDSFVTY